MNSITSFIKRYPQAVFWGIAYLISGGGYTLSLMYPSDFWPFVLWGIALGGALVTGIVDGKAGLKTYFSRIIRVRAGIQWYTVALLTPFALAFIAYSLNILTGAEISGKLPALGQAAGLFVLFFLTNAMEEPGFRGFSLPRFMASRSAFAASLIIGILHAIWHLPLVIGGESSILDLLHPLCGAFLFTWIFNNTNGSVFLAMLLHASQDVAGRFFGSVFSGADASSYSILLAVAFVAMAILLRFFAGRELGRKPEADVDLRTAEQPAMAR
ncbi:MAG TPA: CPBP family intramembrane glutamic endopeptidase [Anaerolineales bacterium]|nr:CPBP family intramembrane glutamic endopeptidase [Anaerolineales bacterium]